MIDYDKVLPQKIREIQPSGIRKFFDIAQQVEGVISLSVGEPDFKTPWVPEKKPSACLKRAERHILQMPDLCCSARKYPSTW